LIFLSVDFLRAVKTEQKYSILTAPVLANIFYFAIRNQRFFGIIRAYFPQMIICNNEIFSIKIKLLFGFERNSAKQVIHHQIRVVK